jgi:hypothetical protein
MARMIPAHLDPACGSPGEREIFRRLRDDPATKDWIVLHSLDVPHHITQVSGEIDFVVIVPSKGVLCIEVKACSRLSRNNGEWFYGSAAKGDPRGPFKQASTAMHSLRSRLAQERPDLSRVIFWTAVIFPYVPFPYKPEEWHAWQVVDKAAFCGQPLSRLIEDILDRARGFLTKCPAATWFHAASQEPHPEQCRAIADTLRGDFEFSESWRSQAERREEDLKRYTEEQAAAIEGANHDPGSFRRVCGSRAVDRVA